MTVLPSEMNEAEEERRCLLDSAQKRFELFGSKASERERLGLHDVQASIGVKWELWRLMVGSHSHRSPFND